MTSEKTHVATGDIKDPHHVGTDLIVDEPVLDGPRPEGWMHHERKIGGLSLSWYASPRTQLIMVSFVCFLCPGMFNALGGLGGGGKTDATLADNMVRTRAYGVSL